MLALHYADKQSLNSWHFSAFYHLQVISEQCKKKQTDVIFFSKLSIVSLENGWHQMCNVILVGYVVHYLFPWTHKPVVGALMSFWLQCFKHFFPLGSSLKLFFVFIFFKQKRKKMLTVHMKHSHSCLVCNTLPPPPTIHQIPTYQKKAPQLLKTHWPRQGLLSKTDRNKLNQWHSLEGASFTLQTTVVSPGRRRTGTRKTVHNVSEAEETSVSGAREQRSLPLLQGWSHALKNGLQTRGYCCCMAMSNTHVCWVSARVLCFMSSVLISRPFVQGQRGVLCYWCRSLFVAYVCSIFQVSKWLNKLNQKSASRIKVRSSFFFFSFFFLGNTFQLYKKNHILRRSSLHLVRALRFTSGSNRTQVELGKGCK